MFYTPDSHHGLPHNPFISCVVPRPIGWISTVSRAGEVNLAPYSLFNIVRYEPPTVMFAANGPHKDGGVKDSASNAIETGEFVYNMATWDLRDQVNNSSGAYDREVNEFEQVGLDAVKSEIVKPPRVAQSPVQFECRTTKVVALSEDGGNTIVFGNVVGIHIADWALKDGMLNIPDVKPLARMGYMDFTAVSEVFSMASPKVGGGVAQA